MSKALKALSCAFGLALCLQGTARAQLEQITFTGTVEASTNNGAFASLTDLAGASFTASFVFNTSIGAFANSGVIEYSGGSSVGTTSPIVSTSLTIGGITVTPGGGFDGYVSNSNGNEIAAGAEGNPPFTVLTMSINTPNLPFTLTGPLSYTVNPKTDSSIGQFETYSGGSPDTLTELLYLYPSTVTIAGAVPEPQTYALMLAGLGFVGAVVRRRKLRQP